MTFVSYVNYATAAVLQLRCNKVHLFLLLLIYDLMLDHRYRERMAASFTDDN